MRAILIGVFILLFALFAWFTYKHFDGFEDYEAEISTNEEALTESLPTSEQSSSIPTDTPGASTDDPTVSVPQTLDIQSLSDSILIFTQLRSTTPVIYLDDVKKQEMTILDNVARDVEPQLEGWLSDPSSANLSVSDISDLRNKFLDTVNLLKNTPVSSDSVRSQPAEIGGAEEESQNDIRPTEIIQNEFTETAETAPNDYTQPTEMIQNDYTEPTAAVQNDYTEPTAPAMNDYTETTDEYGNRAVEVMPSSLESQYGTIETQPEIRNVVSPSLPSSVIQTVRNVRTSSTPSGVSQSVQSQPAQFGGAKNQINTFPAITSVATPPDKLSLNTLHSLQFRIGNEIKRLQQLRTRSPTILQRITQLTSMNADLTNYISSVRRNTMNIQDVPISQEAADSFLRSFTDTSKPLPNITSATGVSSSSMMPAAGIPTAGMPAAGMPAAGMPAAGMPAAGMPAATMPSQLSSIQPLLNMAKFLKWNLNIAVNYDPDVAQRERVLDRVQALEERLTNLLISETPPSTQMMAFYMNELNTLKSFIDSGKTNNVNIGVLNNASAPLSSPDYPNSNNLANAQGQGFGTNSGVLPNGEHTAQVYVRPGVLMTSDKISKRGSLAAFDPSVVGGADYKQRALELCRQVGKAELGSPRNFGCISDPRTVSNTYSWKGNYEMVCRRLGDTWGAWYPEMFGCPKYDPTKKYS
jgi:hypothetical protein